ncbi:hypothetical protein D3218_07555 [Aureimonas flava]|uniref:Uncharacterized protein n=1 Tax=Aureimonas flava TaxID=2320271 RepID=A0A3A1WVI7_9HYPH|nr:hypothetical protein [Aureimonas flava]RIY02140.1 hypothetical protein D3218_07555 [Aureimonas flava]
MADLRTDKARQGRTGRPVLYVLIAGLALCLVVFIGLQIYGMSLPDENIGGVEASGTTAAPATPDNSQTGVVTPGTPAPGTQPQN